MYMFEIQEDHVRKILIVVSGINHLFYPWLLVDASMTNVSKLVKTIMTAHIKINVGTKSACPRNVLVEEIKIVDRATNAFLKNVSLDVNIKETVRRAKNVLMTIVPFH